MKKLILAFSFLASGFFAAEAQQVTTTTTTSVNNNGTESSSGGYKPSAGTKSFQFGINGLDAFNLSGGSQAGGTLLFRYYLSEDLAIRLGLGMDRFKRHDKDEVTVGTGTIETESDTSSTSIFFVPGIQKSLGNNARVEPYVGVDLLFGRTRARSHSEAAGIETTTKYAPATTIGLIPAVGFNYWVVQGLSIGAEFNWGPRWTFFGKYTSETTGAPTVESDARSRITDFGTSGTGLITVAVSF